VVLAPINGDYAILWPALEITILDHCRTRIKSNYYAVMPNVSVSNEENSVTVTVKSKLWGLNYDSIIVVTIEVRFQQYYKIILCDSRIVERHT
jgi:hypothetical protein